MSEASIVPGPSAAGVDLTGRSALVTGAASGIGRACAGRLAAAGAEVTVMDLNGDAAREVAEEFGGKAAQADLSNYGVFDDLEVEADIVVNNAGLQHVAAVEEFPPERFSMILRVMLEAPFRIVQKALPRMYERGWGRVTNISSIHGLIASPYKSAYMLRQAWPGGFLEGRRLGGWSQGRDVELHLPRLRTHAAGGESDRRSARTHGISEDEVIEKIMLTEPAIKRLIEPEEVAELATFLCAPEASFINGASLVMDGGATAH